MPTPTETNAFPAHLAADVTAVIPAISDYQLHPPAQGFTVNVQGEQLQIPYRVYYRQSQVLKCAGRPGDQGHIALCLGTRHHDGLLREECTKQLIAVERPWVAPFITQLIGEYVVEIVQVIERELPKLNAQMYGEYLKDNAALHGTIGRRVVSYWNEYYRSQYPKLEAYPGTHVLNEFRGFAESALTLFSSGPPPAAAELKRWASQ
ncbi:hypothetical protein [Roseateles sp. PN1]|uniref:hypothetical protein n=1 Tax=Roseateles sp. PN1 TaxID=3137372 RepID=UPI00313A4407